jgi:hypothetical protein
LYISIFHKRGRIMKKLILAIAFLLCSSTAQVIAVPIYDAGTEHYYEAIYVAPGGSGLTWDNAKNTAGSLSYLGLNGHLATITSQNENDFVTNNLGSINGYWLGGYQPTGSTEPDGGWEWITGEVWNYTNWYTSEPNNNYGGEWGGPPAGSVENALHYVIRNSSFVWNDFAEDALAPGYIVEYEAPAPAPAPVPEPATVALLGIGLVGLAGAEVRRKRKAVDNS